MRDAKADPCPLEASFRLTGATPLSFHGCSMARIRTIKPEFPHSESMGNVSRDARLTFILLWTLADDSGRLRGNSRMLASLLYPYDDDAPSKISGWLSELERVECITLYEHDGTSYCEIRNWLAHQKIDKPSKSKFPAPREDSRMLSKPREHSSLDQGPRTKDQRSGGDAHAREEDQTPLVEHQCRDGPAEWAEDEQRLIQQWNSCPNGARGVVTHRGAFLSPKLREAFRCVWDDPVRRGAMFDAVARIKSGIAFEWDRPALSLAKFLESDEIDKIIGGGHAKHIRASERPLGRVDGAADIAARPRQLTVEEFLALPNRSV